MYKSIFLVWISKEGEKWMEFLGESFLATTDPKTPFRFTHYPTLTIYDSFTLWLNI